MVRYLKNLKVLGKFDKGTLATLISLFFLTISLANHPQLDLLARTALFILGCVASLGFIISEIEWVNLEKEEEEDEC